MPIPTDTFWNIKRLNVVFAVSAVLLLAVTGWSIVQDFNQQWRQPQRDGKVWEAALVEEKIDRETTPDKEARLQSLNEAIAAKEKQLQSKAAEIDSLKGEIRKYESDQADMEFRLNTLKANVTVALTQLQDAIVAKDDAAADRLRKELAEADGNRSQKLLAKQTEDLFAKKNQVAEAREKLKSLTADVDALNKQKTKLNSDAESLKKKLASLQPPTLLAKLSNQIRETPLLQFINPATKVQQVVLPDVRTSLGGVKEVETIDRCITCHVNINKKEFTEASVIAYLEEQVASARNLKLAEQYSGKASDPLATRDKPGAVAMPEFWHLWAVRVAPDQVRKPAALGRITAIAKTIGVGKPLRVRINGKELEAFNYAPDVTKKEDAQSAALPPAVRDQIIAEALKAWIGFGSGRTSSGPIQVSVRETTDEKGAAPSRLVAMKYVEDLRTAMSSSVNAEQWKLLSDRYRRGLIGEANVARRKQGLKDLDPSPALLAHPRLDLYVDADSKHPFESIGCTSCHDGSGQETNFVVAAHTPRPIWVDIKSGAPVLPVQLDPTKAPKEKHETDLSSMLAAVWPHDEVIPERASDIHLVGDEHGVAKTQATTAPTTTKASVEQPPKIADEAPTETVPVPYLDPVTGVVGRAVSQMEYWKREYEPSAPRPFELVYHEWDWPMRPPKYLQANCVRCHTDVNSIKDEAPQVFQGRSLFANMGCINCHQMDSLKGLESPPANPSDIRLVMANDARKVGTDLRNITAKLSAAYINTWIWAPKAFRPSTKMPHFFMLENNSGDEELRRTRQEARSITEYLVRSASKHVQVDTAGNPVLDKDGQPTMGPLQMRPIPASAKGSADAGRIIFASIGCQGCHTNTNEETGEKRNGKPVTLGEKWIVTDLVKNGKLAAQIEAETGKAADAKALSTRAAELFDHMTYNERQLYISENLAPDYSGVAAKYPDGTAKPVFQHHGPELSGIGTKLTAGRTPEQARTWLFNWVKEPRHYSEYTVMPQLRLSDQQALDLTEYLLAQKRTNTSPDDPWKAELTPVDSPKLIELTALFLKSRYSFQTSFVKADDDKELTDLATDALTNAFTTADEAKALAAKMSKDERRMVFLGKKLIAHYGCASCHAINGAETISSPCANLSDWGQKGIDKLDFGYLDHHKLQTIKEDPKTHEPEPSKLWMVNGLSAKASLLTGAEWRANFADGTVAAPVTAAWPEVDHSRTAWLTQKLKNTRVYDRGRVLLEPGKDQVVPDQKTVGGPYDKLKMPTFYLSDREVDAIVTWVISNRDRLVSRKLADQTLNDEAQRVARGRQLVQKFNCVGCHIVESNAPSVQQYYKTDEIATKAPPSLRGEGNKIQHAWLFNFLKHVEPVRPLLNPPPDKKPEIRMPSFPILDQEATDIAAYFNAVSNKESKSLDKTLDPARKYIEVAQKQALTTPVSLPKNPTTLPAGEAKLVVDSLIARAGAQIAAHEFKAASETLASAMPIATAQKLTEQVGPTTKPVADRIKAATGDLAQGRVPATIAWPGDDWYQRPEFAVAADTLKTWALEKGQISPLQLDPTKNKPEEIARNMRTIKFKAEFVTELYNAPYPFVETPRPDVDEARFKKGEAFFYELQCLKCHVLGDPNVPGAQKNPTAPNLSLASRRLQRRWVRHWTQEPPIIQVGTAMPPFFTGLAIFDVHGQAWPRSQGVAEAEAQRVEKIYGNNVEEQEALLLDFIYAAGVRGYTGIQPATAATPTTPAPASAPAPSAASTPPAPSVTAPEKPAAAPTVEPKKEEPKPAPKTEEKPTPPAEKKPAAAAAAPSGAVSVKGVIKLDGKAPEAKDIDMSGVKECAAKHADPVPDPSLLVDDKGNLQNVVVYVSSGLSGSFDAPSEPAVLDQQGCMYHPHVLPVMVGQRIMIKNSDEFLHNVHAMANVNPAFNFGQPNKDEGKAVDPLKAAETFHVKCDVHPWMSAYIVGLENPFFGVSGEDGSFSIANLPPGDYTLTAWHETLGSKEVQVKVEAGKPAEVKISFPAP